jgi:hypothetical protein
MQDYAQTPFAKMVPDSGLQVNGTFTDISENASAFVKGRSIRAFSLCA